MGKSNLLGRCYCSVDTCEDEGGSYFRDDCSCTEFFNLSCTDVLHDHYEEYCRSLFWKAEIQGCACEIDGLVVVIVVCVGLCVLGLCVWPCEHYCDYKERVRAH